MKRFVAPDMRRALEMVREQMGPDAVILSTKRQKDGVEILTSVSPEAAMPESRKKEEEAMQTTEWPLVSDQAWRDQLSVRHAVDQHAGSVAGGDHYAPESSAPDAYGLASGKTREQLAAEIDAAREKMLAAKRLMQAEPTADLSVAAPVTAPAPVAAAPVVSAAANIGNHENDAKLSSIQSEINDLRDLLESQLEVLVQASQPTLAALTKVQRQLVQRLQTLGISEGHAVSVAKRVDDEKVINDAWVEALVYLAHDIPTVEGDLVDGGGVFALIGATGAGKTTTLAKLAARYVMRHGMGKVAVVTTDEARVGARDQLQAIGRLIKVPVIVASAKSSMKNLLAELASYKLVLVDTAGLRTEGMTTDNPIFQLSVLPQVQMLMVIAANGQAGQVARQLRGLPSTTKLAGTILTKLDETAGLGEMIDLYHQGDISLAYTAHGQNIAQDLDVARSHKLITRAVALARPVGKASKTLKTVDKGRINKEKSATAIDQSAAGINVQHL